MSNLIVARKLLQNARTLHKQADDLVRDAMKLMRREPPIRKSKPKRVAVTEGMRREIFRLAKNKDLSIHEIGNRVGLRNSGRVSEILNEKR
jgi:hypothetical protein